jgi:pimeloyl-ACP methyl ester carboxylesterase
MAQHFGKTIALMSVYLVAAAAHTAVAAAPAVPETYVAFCAGRHAGRSLEYCPHVLEIGAPNPRRIIVLEPGADLGAESLEPAGQYLARTLRDTQVWAVERREQDLTDLSRLGRASEDAYYLGSEYLKVTPLQEAAARTWGLPAQIADLRRIVASAQSDTKRRVFLGGHSWGATIALAYAAWDFAGVPGYRGLSGIILIDGGVHDSFAGEGYRFRLTLTDVRRRLRAIASGSPFTGDLGYLWNAPGTPESVPIDYQLAASHAVAAPGQPSALQTRLPTALQSPYSLTNAALFGWLIDRADRCSPLCIRHRTDAWLRQRRRPLARSSREDQGRHLRHGRFDDAPRPAARHALTKQVPDDARPLCEGALAKVARANCRRARPIGLPGSASGAMTGWIS